MLLIDSGEKINKLLTHFNVLNILCKNAKSSVSVQVLEILHGLWTVTSHSAKSTLVNWIVKSKLVRPNTLFINMISDLLDKETSLFEKLWHILGHILTVKPLDDSHFVHGNFITNNFRILLDQFVNVVSVL